MGLKQKISQSNSHLPKLLFVSRVRACLNEQNLISNRQHTLKGPAKCRSFLFSTAKYQGVDYILLRVNRSIREMR